MRTSIDVEELDRMEVRIRELESKLDTVTKQAETGWKLAHEMKADRDALVLLLAGAAERIRELGQDAPELSRIAYSKSLRMIEDALK